MAGLAAKVGELRGFTYLQGLWKEELEFGLLWFVSKVRTGDHFSESFREYCMYVNYRVPVAPLPSAYLR